MLICKKLLKVNRIMKSIIGVIGQGGLNKEMNNLAEEVGREIAKNRCILICGGLGGVMEASCKGAKRDNVITIGLIPGNDKNEANKYVDIPIVTGMGEARNLIIVKSSDVLNAISGSYGTLSELSFALKFKKPVVGINTWDISEQIHKANNPKEAVELALGLIN